MKSVHTEEYHELFAKLPQNVQKQARKANRLFEVNPYYPGLRFKCIDKEKSWYSVRINESYRVVGVKATPFSGFLLENIQTMITSKCICVISYIH